MAECLLERLRGLAKAAGQGCHLAGMHLEGHLRVVEVGHLVLEADHLLGRQAGVAGLAEAVRAQHSTDTPDLTIRKIDLVEEG